MAALQRTLETSVSSAVVLFCFLKDPDLIIVFSWCSFTNIGIRFHVRRHIFTTRKIKILPPADERIKHQNHFCSSVNNGIKNISMSVPFFSICSCHNCIMLAGYLPLPLFSKPRNMCKHALVLVIFLFFPPPPTIVCNNLFSSLAFRQ